MHPHMRKETSKRTALPDMLLIALHQSDETDEYLCDCIPELRNPADGSSQAMRSARWTVHVTYTTHVTCIMVWTAVSSAP